MTLEHTDILSSMMHGLVLREEGSKAALYSRKVVGLGDALESLVESKFFTPASQSSYRHGLSVVH